MPNARKVTSGPKRAFTPSQAAFYMGVGQSTVFELVKAKKLISHKNGKSTLIMIEEMDRFLDALPVREVA